MDTEEDSVQEAGLQEASPLESSQREACRQHPEATVVRRCDRCSVCMCATCDFEFAGGIHLCPRCATHEETRISGKRRRLATWSIGLGAWGVVAFIAFFVIAAGIEDDKQLEALGSAYALLGLFPCIAGAALGFSVFDRRLHNPRWLWAAPAVNTVILAIFLVLTIIGSSAE